MTKRFYNRITARRRRKVSYQSKKDRFILIRCSLCGKVHGCCYGRRRMDCASCASLDDVQTCFYVDAMAVVERLCPDCHDELHKERLGGG